ncbi:hypothetical protein DUE52_29215 [Larkinella punicea]|uniref:Uncharacterized protein n=1 Tax=Larkinella punicea TaxID=2315727 RepID=A0A368JED3_9BACT|nr:hypothetical protein DUE52_29215 [Larkinella punicea]
MNVNIIAEKLRIKYDNYVEGSLTENDYRFWIVYITSAVAGCLIYYFYTFKFKYFFNIKDSRSLALVMAAVCLLFPAVSLRRLHIVAVFILIHLVKSLLEMNA